MPDTKVLPLLPDYGEHEGVYRRLAHIRDYCAGIPVQEPEAMELSCQDEDGEEEDGEEEDDDMKEFWERVRRKDQFLDECRRKWKEQGKTEEECKRMWRLGCHEDVAVWRAENGIALADWRAANGIPANFDAMQI